jgi:glycosyl-4,4'-diaponeurosporenoate acyltransferase
MEARGGMFRFLKIKKWKKYIPDAGGWFRGGLNKNEIGLSSQQGRITFLHELNRA